MCTIKIQKGAIENIDRASKQCIWRGNNTAQKGSNLAAWSLVNKPKNKGGLAVLNLKLQNDVLLLKHLHKFYSKQDIPWVNLIWTTYYQGKVPHATREVGSFWWKDVMKLSTIFRGVVWHAVSWGTAPRFFFGRTSGVQKSWLIYSRNFFPLR